jgi:hypothetical protein
LRTIGEIAFDISLWKTVIGVFLLVLAVLLYRRTFPPLTQTRRSVLAALRVIGFGLLLLFIFNPVSVSLTSEARRPLVLVLLDVSKSMSVRDRGERSRRDEAVTQLHRLLASLRAAGEAAVEVLPFASDLAPGPVPPDSIPEAAGEGTDILRAIETAQLRFRSRNLAGIVLLSDGRVTRGMSSTPMNLAAPVFTVGFGDTLEGTDISVERVRYDRVAYVGTATDIEAVVRATGFAGAVVRVQLEENGTIIDSGELSIRDVSAEHAVALTFIPGTAGDRTLTVRVLAPPEDKREENNAESIQIRVLKEKLVVAYIDQFADWNTTFIMDLARRAPRLDIETVTWLPNRNFITLPDRRPWKVPMSQAEFERYDCIVIADDTRNFSVASRIEALDGYIRNGGGLLLLADENTPLRSMNAARLLEPLLPVTVRGPVEVKTGEFYIAPSGETASHPLAEVFDEATRGAALPPLSARLTNLAVTAGAEVPLVLDDGGETLPFCAMQRWDRGVTAIVFGFPLWKWRLAGEYGYEFYNAFTGGLIQYMTEGIDAPPLAVMADRTVYRSGDKIGFTVYTRESRFNDGVRGEVIRADDGEGTLMRVFLFEPDPRKEGHLRAVLDPLPPGEYRITASEVRDGGAGFSGETRITIQPVSVEFLKTSRNNDILRYLADASGGGMIEPADLVTLIDQMDLSPDRIVRRDVRFLRQSIWFFTGIVLVFAAEWMLRKAWGLV